MIKNMILMLKHLKVGKLFKIYVLSLLIIFCLQLNLYSQVESLKFDRYMLADGLSQGTIYDIIQDEKGFLCFATQHGLNKFDGYKFLTYYHNPNDSNSISHNWIYCTYDDGSGNLWLGTYGGGLDKYDYKNKKFYHFKYNTNDTTTISNNFINTFYVDKDNILWIGTDGGGLNKFNLKTEKFIRYKHNENINFSISSNNVTSIIKDKNDKLWIGTTDKGIDIFDPNINKFRNLTIKLRDFGELLYLRINYISEDSHGNIWIGTYNNGLIKFDTDKKKFSRYVHNPNDRYSLSGNRVTVIFEDSHKQFYIGTNSGLNILDRNNEKFTRYRNFSYKPHSISNDIITTIFEDRNGNIWIGTSNGINKFSKYKNKFKHFTHDILDKNSLSNNYVWSIFKDSNKILWVGTNNGLNRYDKDNNRFIKYYHDVNNPNSLSNNRVFAIHKDESGLLWIGTENGLNTFDKDKEKFYHYKTSPNNPNSISSNRIRTIFDDDVYTWIGTFGGGLNRYDKSSGKFKSYTHNPEGEQSISNNYIYSFYKDTEGIIWLGTVNGLNRFDSEKETFQNYFNDPDNKNSISYNMVNGICEDDRGNLWICTGRGLNKFDKKEQKFTRFTKEDGLPSNMLYSILKDKNGFLWISSNRGLTKLNPKTGEVTNFDTRDGLQSNEFNGRACFIAEDGEMFFGGINGFNRFYPDKIKNNPNLPNVVLTGFRIFNKNIELKENISYIDNIIMSYKDNFFTFEFSALEYTDPLQNMYSYKLEGFDKNWIEIGNKNTASYTNLDPGNYTFMIKAANNDGIWNNKSLKLNIIITPPFWKTTWFKILAIFLIVASLHATYKIRVKSIQSRKRELEILVKKRTKELFRKTKALEKSHHRVKSLKQQIEFILAETKTGLDIIDSDLNIRYIDPQRKKIYGNPRGKKCYEYFKDRKESCSECRIKKAFETKEVVVTESVIKRDNNRPIQIVTKPFQNKKGEWLVAEIEVDITERKRIEKETVEKEKLKGILEMAGAACHNINQPLSVICSYSGLLIDDVSENEKIYEDIKTIKEAIWEISDILRKLKNITRYKTTDYSSLSKIVDI